jgi:integrase
VNTSCPALPADAQVTLQHYMSRARSSNTYRSYHSQWQRFATWCGTHNLPCLPAHPHVVAAYLAGRAQEGAKVATLNVILSAIAFAHTAEGLVFNRRDPALLLVVDGIRRAHVRAQHQVEPLTAALLREVLTGFTGSSLDRRDAALLALLYTFALRASEAIALDWMRPGDGGGCLRMVPDRTEIALLGSKAEHGEAETIAIPAPAAPSALRAIETWAQHARIEPGEPLLRPLTRGGSVRSDRMRPGSVSGIIKRAIARHLMRRGMPVDEALMAGSRFAGHSGRVGFYVSATEAGVAPQHIAAVARHAGLAMVRRYARRANLLRCAPHLTSGVGV